MSFWGTTEKSPPIIPPARPNLVKIHTENKKLEEEAKQANSFWGLAKNTILGTPKALKETLLPTRGYTEEELSKAKPTLKEKITATGKLGAEIFWGLGNLGSAGANLIPGVSKLSEKAVNTKVGGALAGVGQKIEDYSTPKTAGEAKAMRFVDVASNFVPGAGSLKNVSKSSKIIAGTKDLSIITKELKAFGLADDIIERTAPRLVNATNAKQVEQALEHLKLKNNIEKTPENYGIKATNPLAQEARKYKSAEEFVSGVSKKEFRYNDSVKSTATVGEVPIEKFGNKDNSLIGIFQDGDKAGVANWKKKIQAGERPYVLVEYNSRRGGNQIVDGHNRFIAYEQLGIKNIPVLDNTNKVLNSKSQLTDFYNKAVNSRTDSHKLPTLGRGSEALIGKKTQGALELNKPKSSQAFNPVHEPYHKNPQVRNLPLDHQRKLTTQTSPQVPPIKPPQKPFLEPPLSSSSPINTTESGKKLDMARKWITSGKKILEKSGPSGKKMAQVMDNQRVKEDLLTGHYNVRIKKALAGLSKEERINVTEVLEGGKPKNAIVAKRASDLRAWLDEVATRAEKEGFEMKTGKGGTIPFKKRDDYFPRQYDFDDLAKGKKREEALEHLVTTGQARNLAEAETLLENMINNAQRRAGNLENPRMLDLPGYEKDPSLALPRYAQSVAKRFTEAEAFGKKDEKIAELIKQITNEKGDYKEAQRIFDFTVDGSPKNKLVSAINQFNVVTKLSLSAITNATQTINTATKAGIINTVRGAWRGFTKEGKELAELVNAYDDFILVKEGGFKPAKVVEGVMYVFKKVENFNRRTAANTGALRQKQLVDMLKKDPQSSYAIRQLESLGIDTQKALAGKLTDDDVLTAANKMIEKTQFKVDPLDVPPSWKTPVGRLLTQFKSFSFMQTKFARDEILKEARHGNFAPLVTFVSLAVPASYVVAMVRNKLTGRENENIDIREWDKWMKALGTIPTDLLIQGKFLKDTFEADYISPLEKSSRVAGTFLGPTAGEAGKLTAGLEQVGRIKDNNEFFNQEKDPYLSLKRQGVEKIPFVGQKLKNEFFAYPTSNKTPEEKALDKKIYAQKDKEEAENKLAKTKIQPIYNQAKELLNADKGEEADALVENMSDEDYEVYKKIRTAERAKTSEKLHDLLKVSPADAVKFLRSQNKREQDRLLDLMTDEEYAIYEQGK